MIKNFRVKYIPLIKYEEGVCLHHLAENTKESKYQQLIYYQQALQKYREVLIQKPYSVSALYNLSKCAKNCAMLDEINCNFFYFFIIFIFFIFFLFFIFLIFFYF